MVYNRDSLVFRRAESMADEQNTTSTTTTSSTTSILNQLSPEVLQRILLEAIASPEEVENDAGRVETHDLSDVVEALKYAQKLSNQNVNPLKCLRQAPIHYRDTWR